MSNQYLKLRRSAVPGKVPDTTSLDFGEIALNTYDGLAYMKVTGSFGEKVLAIGITSGSFTGSLFGTSSWAENAITASYALNAETGNVSGSQYYVAVFSSSNSVNTGSIYDSGSFTAIGATITTHPEAPERFFVDASDTESYNLISGHGTINNYLQLNIKNFSSGDTGSSDIVATADNGDESSFFIDMGVNSSGYNDPNGIGQSNDAYLYSTAQDLLIGNASSGKKVIIFNGSGPALDNARVYITSEGTVGINASDNSLSNPEALLVEPLVGGSLPNDFNNLIIGRGTINESYLQLNIINKGSGSYASADIVATNDAGTETSNYIDMGINSSNHIVDTTFAPGGPNDSYLLSTANDLLIGSSTSGDVVLWTGADFDDKANAKLSLRPTNQHSLTGSLSATEGFTGSLYGTASWAENALTSSIAINAFTASSADNFVVRNSLTASSAIINGTLTAQTLVVQTVTSSVIYSSGSNVFGNDLSNTQVFTGSVSITGSLSLNGNNVITSDQTSSMSVATASLALTASYVVNSISASYVSGSAAIVTNLSSSNDANINGLTIGRGNNNIITNTIVGNSAGSSIIDTTRSVLIGYEAGKNIITSTSYTGTVLVGYQAGFNITTGFWNVAVGDSAGYTLTSGTRNTLIGLASGLRMTTGSRNTIIGSSAGLNVTTGNDNIIIGANAGQSITTGISNIVIGPFSSNVSTTGNYNVFIGGLNSLAFSSISNNIILADGQGNIKYRWDTIQNNIYGNLAVTGSVTATLGFTGSLFGTSSWAENAISSSYSATASYALNAANVFPYTGSARVTGSLDVTGSVSISGSLTAEAVISTQFTYTNWNGADGLYSDRTQMFRNYFGNTFGRIQFNGGINAFGTVSVGLILAGWNNNDNALHVIRDQDAGNNYIYIGSTTTNAHKSASFHVDTPGKGVLLPRMGTAQYTNMSAPSQGLFLYDTGSTTEGFYYFSSGSIKSWTRLLNNTGSQVISGSLTTTQGFTGSLFGTASWSINAITASYALNVSGTIDNAISASYAFTASSTVSSSFTQTASFVNPLIQNVLITGSLSVTSGITGSLEGTSSWAINAITASYILNAVSSSYAFTASLAISSSFATSASYSFTASSAINANNALTASSADNFIVRQSITASNALINGTLTAQTLVVQTVSSSVVYSSGSNIFGNDLSNTQVFTGSVSITGSLSLNGNSVITSDQTSSMSVLSASFASTASYASNIYNSNGVLTGNRVVDSGSGYELVLNPKVGFVNGFMLSASAGNVGTYINTQGYSTISSQLYFYPNSGTNVAQTLNIIPKGSGFNSVFKSQFSVYNTDAIADSSNTEFVTFRAAGTLFTFASGKFGTGVIRPLMFSAGYATDSATNINQLYLATSSNVIVGGADDIGVKFDVRGTGRYTNNLTVTGSVTATNGITGSLFGTASWAQNSITASFATTASYILNAVSSSYAFTASSAISSSFSTTSLTSSFANSVFDIGVAEFNSTSSITVAGTTIVSSINTGSFSSAFYNYTISSGSNARSGQVMSVWNGSTIRYTEVTTMDIGSTATASFAVTLSGANVNLSYTAPGVWTVKNIANLL